MEVHLILITYLERLFVCTSDWLTIEILVCVGCTCRIFFYFWFLIVHFRCIRIYKKMDEMIQKAGTESGLTTADLFDYLPNELTIWVDPHEVHTIPYWHVGLMWNGVGLGLGILNVLGTLSVAKIGTARMPKIIENNTVGSCTTIVMIIGLVYKRFPCKHDLLVNGYWYWHSQDKSEIMKRKENMK